MISKLWILFSILLCDASEIGISDLDVIFGHLKSSINSSVTARVKISQNVDILAKV